MISTSIHIRHPSERLYLINWRKVNKLGIPHNQATAHKVQELKDYYRREWFGLLGFIVPSFRFTGDMDNELLGIPSNSLDFINGRHRIAVLSRHINHIPMGVVIDGCLDQNTLNQIVVRELRDGERFDLPDLPFLD